jgi:membrane-associated protease RseP (regulator of RpoE activity)
MTTTDTQENPGWFELLMASGYGRLIRIVIGLTIIGASLALLNGWVQYTVGAFGLIPIGAGVFNLCPVAPAWGGHFLGSRYCGRKQ